MGRIWEIENRFQKMMEVEIAVAQVQASLKIIPLKAAQQITQKARFSVERIHEIEQKTKHDVIAFVSCMAENVGEMGRFIHWGLTSSDVLDTAFSLQVVEAGNELEKTFQVFEKNLKIKIRKYSETLCAGRTHGMFAEVTTFGLKLAGFLAEFERNKSRVLRAIDQFRVVKLSGAVGTYSSQSAKVENLVGKKLKLIPETIATQVVPRDRHAEVIFSLAMMGAGIERFAIEMRHLQRSEVAEVTEGFSLGQKGSSAMPHKKNPISAENVTGLARLLKAYSQTALDNIPLWHERDISHSSAERVIFPDAFIVLDYMVNRMALLVEGLSVNEEQMQINIDRAQGQLFSSQILLALVDKGLDRETAYAHVQRLCHSLNKEEHLREKILNDSELKLLLKPKEVMDIFKGLKQKKSIKDTIGRIL